MKIKEIVEVLKKRGLSTDEAIELIHILTKVKSSDDDVTRIGSTPAGLFNVDDALTILNQTLLKDYI